ARQARGGGLERVVAGDRCGEVHVAVMGEDAALAPPAEQRAVADPVFDAALAEPRVDAVEKRFEGLGAFAASGFAPRGVRVTHVADEQSELTDKRHGRLRCARRGRGRAGAGWRMRWRKAR